MLAWIFSLGVGVYTSCHTPMYGNIALMVAKSKEAAGSRPVTTRRKAPARAQGLRGAVERTPLGREDWVEAATAVLLDQGIDHVRVDVLATELKVTRGSFYWHFSDRDDLLREVLQQWRRRATIDLSRRILEVSSEDLQTRLRTLISLPHRGRSAVRAARIELAIRAWARRDSLAREAVDEADRSRLQVHIDTFRALGYSSAESSQRAFLTYSYELGESLMHHLGSDEERRARQDFVEQLVNTALTKPFGA